MRDGFCTQRRRRLTLSACLSGFIVIAACNSRPPLTPTTGIYQLLSVTLPAGSITYVRPNGDLTVPPSTITQRFEIGGAKYVPTDIRASNSLTYVSRLELSGNVFVNATPITLDLWYDHVIYVSDPLRPTPGNAICGTHDRVADDIRINGVPITRRQGLPDVTGRCGWTVALVRFEGGTVVTGPF